MAVIKNREVPVPGNQERRWQTEKIKTFLVVAQGRGAVGLWGFFPDVRRFIKSAAQKGRKKMFSLTRRFIDSKKTGQKNSVS